MTPTRVLDPARSSRPSVVVVGGGAAGTLTALHLLRTAGRRSATVDVTVVDPVWRWARGTAFGTTDEAHLLNVPASGMSALPEDPGHFVRWAGRELGSEVAPGTFLPRAWFARYLDDTLTGAVGATTELTSLRHVRATATSVRRTGSGITVLLGDGRRLDADAAVVATGLSGVRSDWAPPSLRDSAFFVDDPWRPGSLDVVRRDHAGPADVLLVGTGLTMVDAVLSITGPGTRAERRVHAVSRSGRLPRVHQSPPRLAAIPEVSGWSDDLPALRKEVSSYVRTVQRSGSGWRTAVDGLRFRLTELWQRLDESEREDFLRHHAGAWNVVRHRMPPSSARRIRELRHGDRLQVHSAQVVDATPLTHGGLAVALDDGSRREVGWVVGCTGPQSDVRQLGVPLLDDLLSRTAGPALAQLATAGMGFRTEQGRLLDGSGRADAPVWTLGALRRGELWESTAVPEIRSQALAVATSVLDAVEPPARRGVTVSSATGRPALARPRDLLGLPLSTTAGAAAAFNAGLHRVMTLQSGAEELLRDAVRADPGFAVAHAALAMLGHEAGAVADVHASLRSAQQAVQDRGDAREVSLVDVVSLRVHDVRGEGAQALMDHIAGWPRDVLAVSAAVPTIAFSGITDVQLEAWDLVEELAPAYGDHWWYISLLAFTRQEQHRYDEAALLAENALACEPASGHAVHALAHVLYETGQHAIGRTWLDHWVAESGRDAVNRAHFSWHAALHELALDDPEAARRRYDAQLAPPIVTGVRGLVDASSLLWRWQLSVEGWRQLAGDRLGHPPHAEARVPSARPVLDSVDASLLVRPETPFVAFHAALALAAAGDRSRLRALRSHCASSSNQRLSVEVVATCDALGAVVDGRWGAAVTILEGLLPTLDRVGGSAAQRDVMEEALLLGLVREGADARAAELLTERLGRRPSPLDERRLAAITQ